MSPKKNVETTSPPEADQSQQPVFMKRNPQSKCNRLIFLALRIAVALIIATMATAPFYLARRGEIPPPYSPTVPVPTTHDMEQHLAVIYQFHKAIQSGDLYPRWLPDFDGGYGLPWLNYYPPGFYYVTEVIYLVFGDWVITLFVFSILILAASGLAFYLVARLFYSRSASAVAALFYMLAPYHLLELYWRGALPEYMGFVFVPLMVYLTYKVAEQGRVRTIAGLGLVGGLYLFSHLPVAYLMILALGVYGILWSLFKKDIRIALRIGCGLALAILFSSIYLLPTVFEDRFITKTFYKFYKYNDSYIALLPEGDEFQKLIYISFVFLALTLLIVFMAWRAGKKSQGSTAFKRGRTGGIARKKQKSARSKPASRAKITHEREFGSWGVEDISKSVLQTRLFIILSVIALFMVTPFSSYVSFIVPRIKSVGFAWRWLLIASFYTACVLAAAVNSVIAVGKWKPIKVWCYRVAVGGIILANIWISANCVMRGAFAHENLYVPLDHRERAWIPEGAMIPPPEPVMPNFSFDSGTGKIDTVIWEPSYRAAILDAKENSTIRVKTFDFPGWKARIDGQPVPIKSDAMGVQLVQVPAGRHRLELSFVNTPVRNVGTILSLLAFVIICSLFVLDRLRRDPITVAFFRVGGLPN